MCRSSRLLRTSRFFGTQYWGSRSQSLTVYSDCVALIGSKSGSWGAPLTSRGSPLQGYHFPGCRFWGTVSTPGHTLPIYFFHSFKRNFCNTGYSLLLCTGWEVILFAPSRAVYSWSQELPPEEPPLSLGGPVGIVLLQGGSGPNTDVFFPVLRVRKCRGSSDHVEKGNHGRRWQREEPRDTVVLPSACQLGLFCEKEIHFPSYLKSLYLGLC